MLIRAEMVLVLVLALVLSANVATAAPDGPRLLGTADGMGALATCADCPMKLGGMAKRATLLAREREAGGDVLLVDAGNSLFGPESLASQGRVIAELFDRFGYDAINISYRDFRLGAAALQAAVADAKFEAISANLTDSKTGELLFPASAVFEKGGRRLLVVGVTRVPAELSSLPHLARQLEDVGFRPAGEAVQAALTAAPDHDEAVLLYYGSPARLRLDLGELAGRFNAVMLGGAHPDELPPASAVPLLAVKPKGKSLAALEFGEASSAPREVLIDPAIPDDPETARFVAAALQPGTTEPPPPAKGVSVGIPDDVRRVRGPIELRGEGENRGFGLIVHGAEFVYSFAGRPAPKGRNLLLLDVTVENRLAPDLLIESAFPETMQVAEVRRQFFLLLNGRTIVQVLPHAFKDAAHLPSGFRLSPGGAADGMLAFPVPLTDVRTLELRFYADGFAPVVVPLRQGEPGPAKDPIAGPFDNGEVELAVTSFELQDQYLGQSPGKGRKFALVEVRGRSLLAMVTPALALRDGAAPGETARAGQVFEWKKAGSLLQLVTEGRWGYTAHEVSGAAAEVPLLLPDVDAGFILAFEVPATDEEFRLECHFPRMKLSTEKEFRNPRPILFPFGDQAAPGSRKALAVIDDRPLRVGVLDFEWTDTFAGNSSGAKNRWAVFTLAYRNEGDEGGLLDPARRFGLSWTKRKPTVPLTTNRHHPRPGGGLAYLPPGQVRAFRLAYRVPIAVTEVELDYQGVSTATRIPIVIAAPGEATVELAPEEPSPSSGVQAGPAPTREPKGLAGFGINGADVNRAIDRGRDFLWSYLKEKHLGPRRDFGYHRSHTLAALALLHSDGLAKLPDFEAELRKLLATAPLRSTYEMGLYLMAVRSYGDPEFFPRAAEVAQKLIDQQGPQGSWTYGKGLPAVKPEPAAAPAADAESIPEEPARREGPFAITGGAPPAPEPAEPEPEEATASAELERQTPWEDGKDGDNSCTQFVLLGLRAAESVGIGIPDETWRRALLCFRDRQNKDGSFGYVNSTGYGSMTCAGICSIVLAGHGLEVDDPATDPALAWLAGRFKVSANPNHGYWAYYYLYSVERVGRLLDTEFVGPWEWYPLGVRHLLGQQGKDGRWVGGSKEREPEIATSFALLFLTRATETLIPEPPVPEAVVEPPPPPSGPGLLVTAANRPAAGRYYFILDASGSMRAWAEGQSRFDAARAALRDQVAGLPADAEVALRVYGHRHPAKQDAANRDSALEVSLAPLDMARFGGVLDKLSPKGKTPLAFSLSEAAKDLAKLDVPVTVVLLTDGGEEASPPRDPVAAARELGAAGEIDLQIVGFAVNRQDWHEQLEQMAAAAGGSYRPAADVAGLVASLTASGGKPPTFVVRDAAGQTVAEGTFGDEVELSAGSYRLVMKSGGQESEAPFYVAPGATVRVVYDP